MIYILHNFLNFNINIQLLDKELQNVFVMILQENDEESINMFRKWLLKYTFRGSNGIF